MTRVEARVNGRKRREQRQKAPGYGALQTLPAFRKRTVASGAVLLIAIFLSKAATTFTDNFNTNVNYLANGLVGTIWDGIYLGAGEFANTGLGPEGAGATMQCDASISGASKLTLQTTRTSWEGTDDDGFFLFKVVSGDFSAIVHVVSPFNNAAYNTAGLQARAFSAGGNAFGGKENFVSWTRFDQYNFPNYLRNEVNGTVQQINPGGFPNGAYWLRMDRVGNVFRFYQRTNTADFWHSVSFPSPVNGTNLTRTDLSGQALQVGIIHATYNGQLGVQFSDFSLTASNMTFVATPSPATGLTMATNNGNIELSWTPGAGSAGSLVVLWIGTNNLVKETPANGFTYTASATYGQGSQLAAAGYYVVYAGSASSVTVSNLMPSTTYNTAVFSYAGSGSSIAYNHTPATSSVNIPANQVWAQANLSSGDVYVSFTANPGKWYWLQYSDSLSPQIWQDAGAAPILAYSTAMTMIHHSGGFARQRFYRLRQVDPAFQIGTSSGFVTSLQHFNDSFATEYMGGGGSLGDALIKFRPGGGSTWNSARLSTLAGVASSTNYMTPDATQAVGRYFITNGLSGKLVFESIFTFQQDALLWKLNVTNLASQTVEVGDLCLPLPMNTTFSGVTSSAMKHSFISAYDSFIFWMRPNSVGPYLLLTPDENTKLEYWDRLNGYEAYIHSLAASAIAATNYPAVTTQGARWRQTNTSLILPANGSQSYGFKFQWPADYNGVRQALVNEGKIDVHVVPGMTVPTNLFALVALNTTQQVTSVQAEFPSSTQVQYLGATNGNYQLYRVEFAQLGENELTIQFGNGKYMYLEFFVTEPVETLIAKRAAFLVSKQINDASKWYNGLFAEWNVNDQVLVTPDNHDTITGFVVYEIASDDAGESRPAFMGTKEAVFPVQSEVAALDNYIQYFVWNTGQPTGGLQRTTNETYSYAVYGTPDWNNLRTNNSLSIGRGYDYPHIVAMYYGMYQVAKYHPEVTTSLSAQEYLRRAQGTAIAMFAYGGGQATQVGLMNEVVIPDVLDALQAEGMTNEAAALRLNWEQKVNYYVTGNGNLFGSEYSFDSTGFESQQAFAKYAMLHAGSSLLMGSTNVSLFVQQTMKFMSNEITANMFDRGWLETAYYHYGSDFRGDMGDDYVLSYMSQMGGWGLLDYGLNFASNPADYLRLGYGSILSAWATMNSGTPASSYGFWYAGAANDGACGGGYEPLPYNTTWLGQPMHRGPWYYSCEENLGFCGAVRAAATILTDDPIFGRFCYGGTWSNSVTGIQIILADGVRRRFHALLGSGSLHAVIDTDRFATGQPVLLQADLSAVNFTLETGNSASHTARLHFSAPTGTYTVSDGSSTIATLNVQSGVESVLDLPLGAGTTTKTFFVSR